MGLEPETGCMLSSHDVAGTPSSIVGVGAWSNVSNDIPTMITVCMVSGHVWKGQTLTITNRYRPVRTARRAQLRIRRSLNFANASYYNGTCICFACYPFCRKSCAVEIEWHYSLKRLQSVRLYGSCGKERHYFRRSGYWTLTWQYIPTYVTDSGPLGGHWTTYLNFIILASSFQISPM